MRASLIALTAAIFPCGSPALAQKPIDQIPADQRAELLKLDDAAFDAQFRCPESFATEAEQGDQIKRFLNWALLRHGDWTIAQVVDLRVALLTKHQCTQTLENMRRRPASPPTALPPASPPT